MRPVRPGAFAHTSKEFLLLAACCGGAATAPDALTCRVQAGVDWDRFEALVHRHRVGGLVAVRLENVPGLPAAVQKRLGERAQATLLQNLRSLRTQAHLAGVLRAAGIPFLLLKGTPLCLKAFHGDLRVRQSKDIDILVRPVDLPAAEAALAATAFQKVNLSEGSGDVPDDSSLTLGKHCTYRHPATREQLELHWRSYDNPALEKDFPALEECVLQTVAKGVDLPVLPPRELLLHLCLHGAMHGWCRLKWLADVVVLLEAQGNDARDLLKMARQRGVDRAVLQALALSEGVLGVSYAGMPKRLPILVRFLVAAARSAMLTELSDDGIITDKAVSLRLAVSLLFLKTGWAYLYHEVRRKLTEAAYGRVALLSGPSRRLPSLLRVPLWLGQCLVTMARPSSQA